MVEVIGRQYLPGGAVKPIVIPYSSCCPALASTTIIPRAVITPTPASTTTLLPTIAQPTSSPVTPQPNVPTPTADSPFTKYVVLNGYYYGVYPSGSMTRLNPVMANATQYNNPNDSFAAYNTGRGIDDQTPLTPTVLSAPSRPPLGSTRAELRAWSESYTSITRANAFSLGGTAPNQQLLANQLFQSNIQINTPKFLQLQALGESSRYMTSQGYFGSGAALPTSFQTVNQVFGGGATSGYGGGSVGGRSGDNLVATQLATMGNLFTSGFKVPSLFGVTASPVVSGVSTPVQPATQQGFLNSVVGVGSGFLSSLPSVFTSGVQTVGGKIESIFDSPLKTQYQPNQLITSPIYDAAHNAAEWYNENIGKRFDTVVSLANKNPLYQTYKTIADFPISVTPLNIGRGVNEGIYTGIVKSPALFTEFVGMVPVGSEVIVRNPLAFPALAGAGLMLQGRGIVEGVKTRPWEFVGEQIGIGLLTFGAGKAIKVISPIKTTGKIGYGSGERVVAYRGLYFENPVTAIGKVLGRATEWEGTRNLVGVWYEPRSTAVLKNFKTTVGTPVELTRYLGEGFTPGALRTVVDVPLTREFLRTRGGAEGAVEIFDLKLRRLSELQRMKPTTVVNPAEAIETRVSVIKPGTGREFLDILREVAPEHKITGSTEQVVFQRNYPAAHDVDVLVGNPEKVANAFAERYFSKYYGRQNVRASGHSIDLYREGKWETAMDIHPISEHTGILNYGIRTGTPVTVEGTRFIPWSEQMQRKIISSGGLRKTPEGWTTSPALHRGKEIADIIGGIESQITVYEMQGKQPPVALTALRHELRESIKPGSALDKIYNPKKPWVSVAQEARMRLGTYQTDYSPTVYSKLPFTDKYVDFGRYSVFERDFLNPLFEKAGIGFGTRIVSPGAVADYPVALRVVSTGMKELKYPLAITALKPYLGKITLTPITEYLGTGGITSQQQRSIISNYIGTSQSSASTRISASLSSLIYPPSQSRDGGSTPFQALYPGKAPGNYQITIITPRKYPRPADVPGKYPTVVVPPIKYPPGLTPPPPDKYPPGIPPDVPTRYPPVTPPNKPPWYPPAKPPTYPPTIPPNKPPSKPPGRPPSLPPTTPPSRPPVLVPPPTTEVPPAIPITRTSYTIAEWPPKSPKLRQHFDVLGSQWNIRNPIPRFSGGKYPKVELRISNKRYTRTPQNLSYHRPYDKFVTNVDALGKGWHLKNPIPRFSGKYPKKELDVKRALS